jgi:hypothetical protein
MSPLVWFHREACELLVRLRYQISDGAAEQVDPADIDKLLEFAKYDKELM